MKTLYEYQASDIMEWLDNCEEYVLDYIKKIINKYKYWIEVGHEIHLVKWFYWKLIIDLNLKIIK